MSPEPLDAGVIPVLQKPSSLNRDWLIDKHGCICIVENLQSSAVRLDIYSNGISIQGIQQKGYSIAKLIQSMMTGRVRYSIMEDSVHRYSLKRFFQFSVIDR